jgi:Flp pilus assembly secretin CpaC
MGMSVVWGLLVAGAVASGGGQAGAKPEAPRQYQFDCRVTKSGSRGDKKVVGEPRLLTLGGRPASFLSGGEFVAPAAAGKVQFIEFGFRATMNVLEAKGGKLLLDVTVADIQPEAGKGAHTRARTQSVRTVEWVKPKEPLTLTVGPYSFKAQAQPVN